jgi:hypothetical protein
MRFLSMHFWNIILIGQLQDILNLTSKIYLSKLNIHECISMLCKIIIIIKIRRHFSWILSVFHGCLDIMCIEIYIDIYANTNMLMNIDAKKYLIIHDIELQ